MMRYQNIFGCLFVVIVVSMISMPVSAQTDDDMIEMDIETVLLFDFEFSVNSVMKVFDLSLNESYYVEVRTDALSCISFSTQSGIYDYTYFALFLQTPVTYRINLFTVLNSSSYDLTFRTYNESCSGSVWVYGIGGSDETGNVRTVTVVVENTIPYVFSGILSIVTIFVLVKVIVLQRKEGK